MTSARAQDFDTALLERLPASGWPAGLAKAIFVCASGFLIAGLTAVCPLLSIGVGVGVGLFVLLIRVPELLLVLFGFSLGFPYSVSLAGVPVNAADGVLMLWCVCAPLIVIHRLPAHWRLPPVVKAILPFALAVVLSTILASNPPANIKQPIRIIEWFIVLPLAFSVLEPTPRLLRVAAVLMMVVPSIFAIDGVIEFVSHGNSISHILGVPVPGPTDTSGETIRYTFDKSSRAGSTFGGPQALAMFLALTMSVAFAYVVRSPSRGLRAMAVISFLICLAGLGATESRGGLIGALAMMLAIGVFELPRLGKVMALIGLLAISAGALVVATLPGLDGNITSLVPGDRPAAVIDRLTIWRMALTVWGDHPILGVGLGNFHDHALARQIDLLVPLGYQSFHAHNTYLEILADTGIVGLLCYILFLVAMVRCLLHRWRGLRGARRSPASSLILAAIGALAAYIVFASVDMLLSENTHFVLVLLLSMGLLRDPSRQQASRLSRAPRPSRLAAADAPT